MIRARLSKGLRLGNMKIRTLFDDEKEKMANSSCCYCGSGDNLSIDHLLPRKRGGSDSGDNLILACQHCNSSKNMKDMLEWFLAREQFPPIAVFRRYLKLLSRYCDEHDLWNVDLSNERITSCPYSVRCLPVAFPSPDTLAYAP